MGKKKDILWLKELAEARGGECLANEYVGVRAKYEFKCQKDHIWKATANKIQQGEWCPKCAREKRVGNLRDLQRLAAAKGGVCLSDSYINTKTKYLWKCKNDHIFSASGHSVRQDRWCPKCAGIGTKNATWLQEQAAKRGGVCLSTEYVDTKKKYQWKCSEGHIWWAPAKGGWCPKCYGRERKDIHWLQELAIARGGVCLDDTYTNVMAKYTWKCSEGHIWLAGGANIKQGRWCPYCAKKASRSEGILYAKVKEIYPDALPNQRKLLKTKTFELDIWIPSLRKAIEFDGTFWHKSEWAKEQGILERDARKNQQCQDAGIQLLRIDEEDWNKDQASVIIKVFEFLKLT